MAIRTTLRLPFAFHRLNERYRDFTSTIDDITGLPNVLNLPGSTSKLAAANQAGEMGSALLG